MSDNRQWSERLDDTGRNIQKAGGKLTLVLTVPIVGLLLFGWIGLAAGIAIAVTVTVMKSR